MVLVKGGYTPDVIVVPHVKPVRLAFQVSDAAGQPANPALEHERPTHPIVVSRELLQFAYPRPANTGTVGAYGLSYAFPSAGDYVLYDKSALAGTGDEVQGM